MSRLEERVLALDLRPRSFGFVVFEGPGRILDWGARSFRRGVNRVRVPFGSKIERLIGQFAPDVFVVKRPRTKKIDRLIKEIRSHAKVQKTSVCLLPQKTVDLAFSGHNDNKNQIAINITEHFPELLQILPPRRRPWQSEDYRMSIFDAAAIGIAYFSRKEVRDPPVPQN